MPTPKQHALAMVKKLPEKATWDDIMYEIYVRKKIDAGITAADEGRVMSQTIVKKRFLRDKKGASTLPDSTAPD